MITDRIGLHSVLLPLLVTQNLEACRTAKLMNLLKMTITPGIKREQIQDTGKFKENKDQMISFLNKFLDHFNSIALFSSLKFLV